MEDLSVVVDHFGRTLRRTESGKYVERTVRPTAAVWWEKEVG